MEKTEAVVFRGPYERSPLTRMNGQRVKFKSQVKYLGVILDRKLNFRAHVSYVTEKAKIRAVRLRSFAATRWGIRALAMKVLCDGAVVPLTTYAASVWTHRSRENAGLAKAINRVQRSILIVITEHIGQPHRMHYKFSLVKDRLN